MTENHNKYNVFHFDRYCGLDKMAQGAKVKAKTETEAIDIAKSLFLGDSCKFKLIKEETQPKRLDTEALGDSDGMSLDEVKKDLADDGVDVEATMKDLMTGIHDISMRAKRLRLEEAKKNRLLDEKEQTGRRGQMGIRVHKAIGYGISNVYADSSGLNDTRFNLDAFSNIDEKDHIKAPELAQWAEEHLDLLLATINPVDIAGAQHIQDSSGIADRVKKEVKILQCLTRDMENIRLYESYIYNEEYGLPNVFMLMPMAAVGMWRRYDDIIDYEEERKNNGCENRFEYLSWAGIYPYTGAMVRYRGDNYKNVLKGEIPKFISDIYDKRLMNASTYSELTGRWSDNVGAVAKDEFLEDLKHNWRCQIPLEIYIQLCYTGIVKDVKSFVNELRPMLYVYWS